jgi:hypothetical protein
VIEGVSQVIVEVEDEDQVLKFWTETMSSSRTRPTEAGRWIEVRTRDRATIFVLRPPHDDRPTAP